MKEEKQKKNILQFLKKNIRWIVLVIAIVLFIDIVEDIFENEINGLDQSIYHFIAQFISEPLTIFFKIITQFGYAFVIMAVCIICLITMKDKKQAGLIILNLMIIFIINQVLKQIFQRPRPTEYRIVNESGYSFPSAHSMVSTAFYGFIIYWIYKNVENQNWKWIGCIFLTVLIGFIGISRIYLGVHYASDVVGGFCFSLAYLALFTNIVSERIQSKKEIHNA